MEKSKNFYKNRLDQLPPIEFYLKELRRLAEGHEITSEGTVHPFISLDISLRHFEPEPTYKRARDLWLKFYDLGFPPPREIEAVFVKQLKIYASDWEWRSAKKAPPGLMFPGLEHNQLDNYDRIFEETREDLKKNGFKYTNEEVRQVIAAGMNEYFGDGKYTEGSIRKHFERLRKKLEKHGF